jgi:DNA-directed RNA polymerase subunit alpha
VIKYKPLVMPRPLTPNSETLTRDYGEFTAEPFERGFGITLGHALRRVMLSAIPGAAVTSIKIDGVDHEFSSVSGVFEDVTEMVLNIKQLRLKLKGSGEEKIRLSHNKKGEVTAASIITGPNVEIMNPDLHIATVESGAKLDMEMTVGIGRGYVPAERNKKKYMDHGVIPVDSIYCPIKNVVYRIENARVGQKTDYDRLVMEVWTDGSIEPADAIGLASKILIDHFSLFVKVEDEQESEAEIIEEPKEEYNENLDRSIEELELSVRSYNCLKAAGIKTVRELIQKDEGAMLKFRNFGRKSLNEIKDLLTGMGLGFGMKPEDAIKVKVEE